MGVWSAYFHNLEDLQPQTSLLKGSNRIRSSLCVKHVAKRWACVNHRLGDKHYTPWHRRGN